jgi:hypothetical protein
MQTVLTFLVPPKNQKAKILKALIECNEISERDFSMNGFRTRISELINDYDVPIQHQWKEFTSEFGNPGRYRVHYLLTIDLEKATKIYEQLNK